MKKKTAAGIAVLSAVFLMAGIVSGCGKQDGKGEQGGGQFAEVERIVLKDINVDKYVTLGDYKGIRVERTITVNEDELEYLFHDAYINSFPEEFGVKDREVGDTANIDYVGKTDGEAFSGGTAQGANLTIGSHTFIDGFEDGLVGVMPGETVDLNLKFPDHYENNAELAGQDVVFTVTVNYIIPAEKMDEVVPYFGVGDVTNLDELHQYVYDYLYEYESVTTLAEYKDQVLEAFMQTCAFQEIPQEMYDSFREMRKEGIEQVAAGYSMDIDSFVSNYYGVDLETFLQEYIDVALRQNIAMQAVANREGLGIDDDTLQETLREYASYSGFDTMEEFLNGATEEDFREHFMIDNVLNYLVEIAQQK